MASKALMSCSMAAVYPSVLSSSKSKFAAALPMSLVSANGTTSRFMMSAEWMPGQSRPAHLDGSAPGYVHFCTCN